MSNQLILFKHALSETTTHEINLLKQVFKDSFNYQEVHLRLSELSYADIPIASIKPNLEDLYESNFRISHKPKVTIVRNPIWVAMLQKEGIHV
jgi:hypothetical protein